jgi:hypothetical protein
MGNPRNKNKKLRGEKRMQKWKVCKKLMAVILTLCMALPLISNQYLVVRAEETGTGTTDTKSISYTEVPTLQIGENTITTDAQVVNYTDQSGEEAVWNGHVYQYTVPDDGSYVIGVTYMGDDENTYLTLKCYTLDANNHMQEQSNAAVAYYRTKTDVLSPILENGKTYYFKFSYEKANQECTEATDMQDARIFIKGEIPEMKDLCTAAQEITKATSETVLDADKQIMKDECGNVFYGKLYQITIPSGYESVIEADMGRIDIYEISENDARLIDTKDYIRAYDG